MATQPPSVFLVQFLCTFGGGGGGGGTCSTQKALSSGAEPHTP